MNSVATVMEDRRTSTDLWLMALRIVLALPIAASLPFFFEQFGEQHPSGGLNAVGLMLGMVVYGGACAGIFLVVGSILHFCLRKRPWRQTVFANLILAMITIGFLAYVASSVEYVDIETGEAPPPVSQG